MAEPSRVEKTLFLLWRVILFGLVAYVLIQINPSDFPRALAWQRAGVLDSELVSLRNRVTVLGGGFFCFTGAGERTRACRNELLAPERYAADISPPVSAAAADAAGPENP